MGALLFFCFSGLASDFKLPEIERTILDNGLKLVLISKHQIPLVEGQLVVKSGALVDPKGKEGLANITARMLSRGAAGRTADEIAEAVDDMGAQLSVSSDWETSRINFLVLKDRLPEILRLCADLALHPSLEQDSLEEEKDRISDEIAELADDNWRLADRWFYRVFYEGTRLAVPEAGKFRSIADISPEDVHAFYDRYYHPGNALLMLGGDLDSECLGLVKEIFGSWKTAEPPLKRAPLKFKKLSGKTLWMVDKPDLSQSHIRIGRIGISWDHPDYFAAQVLNTYFGGGLSCVLMEELRRKRGLTYGVSSQFDFGVQPGPFFIWTFTANEKTAELIRLTLELMENVSHGGISDDEIEAAKKYRLGNFANLIQAPEYLFEQIIRYELSRQPAEMIEKYAQNIQAVTVQQVREAARKYIDPDNIMIVVLGKRAEVADQLEKLIDNIRYADYKDILED